MLLHVMALAQGIYFEKISVKEALEKAQKEKKMVFVDMWATWCVPCKMLANSLFTQKEVGSYMNSHFICVKCDIDTARGEDSEKEIWGETSSDIVDFTTGRGNTLFYVGR